jgi:hypothetical protein
VGFVVSGNRATPSNPTSYVQRDISITITLGEGTFGQTGKNTVTLDNLRVVATISKGGFPAQDHADIRIYGVSPDIMNQLVTLTVLQTMVRAQNTILVKAGDATNGMSIVFFGNTVSAWKNLDGAPETFLNITAVGAGLAAVQPVAPLSFAGTSDVATVMSGIATLMGLPFQNSGVNVKLSNVYLAGTALDQAQALARAANIEMAIDTTSNPPVLAIWPKTGTRGGQIPLIGPGSGLVRYPTYRDLSMNFRCIFNPNIVIGGQIQMQSTSGGQAPPSNDTATMQQLLLAGANGYWYVQAPLTYDLSSQVPDGPWFCDVVCARVAGLPSP